MVVELRARPSTGSWMPVAWTLSMFALVGLAVAFADRPIATYSHDALHRPGWASLLTRISIPAPPLIVMSLVALIMVGAAWSTDRSLTSSWRTVLAAACATLFAIFAVFALKYVFGRMWPETWVENNPSWIHDHKFGFLPLHGGAGYESFPSGHTTRITAPFAVLWQRLPRFRLLYVVPPLLVMVGLLAADFHWLSDCLAGIWLGSACAWVVLNFV
jgi:membrane-associated phospholipid phosphatase